MMPAHRVLVVDDHPDAAEIACALLELFGHQCAIATTGQQGLARAAEFEPDVAIVDIGLPDISGYEVARQLRASSSGRPLFLAALTGWGAPEDRDRAFAAGFDYHVTKPADAEKLREILARADLAAAALDAGTLHRT